MKCTIFLARYNEDKFGFVVKTDSYYWLRHKMEGKGFMEHCFFNSSRNAIRYFKDVFKKRITYHKDVVTDIDYEMIDGTLFVTKVK